MINAGIDVPPLFRDRRLPKTIMQQLSLSIIDLLVSIFVHI